MDRELAAEAVKFNRLPNQVAIVINFLAFLLLFTGVVIYSATRKQNNTADYLLASRNVNPWLTALSAFATNYSGFMFIGLIGWTYRSGISTFWPMLITLLGQYIAWLLVHKQLRVVSGLPRKKRQPEYAV